MENQIGRFACVIAMVLALSAVALPMRATPTAWQDPSPHRIEFVRVSGNVRLEVLDWGGSGEPVILLAGSGHTAHVFDDFAPKLTAHYHVYGITRRGYGASGFDPNEYGIDRLGDDIVAVMDALGLRRAILVGHSFAGAELSDLATRHADRVMGLIYLEAAYTFAFRNDEAPSMSEFQHVLQGEPQPPPPGQADLTSFASLQEYQKRVTGIALPESELRQTWYEETDGHVGARRKFPGSTTIVKGTKSFSHIPQRALVFFANPHSLGPWLENNPDRAIRAKVKAYAAEFDDFTRRQEKAVADGMPAARILTIAGADHAVFISNEDEVLREMRRFMAGL